MSTVALNNLLTYILSLGLSQRNQKWLAEHLLEANKETEAERQYRVMKANLTEAMHELEEHKKGNLEFEPIEKLLDELQD